MSAASRRPDDAVASPVNQRVILAAVVLDLEHPDAGNVPLEVELDERGGRPGLGRHHPLVHAALHVARHVAAVGAASGRRGNV